MSAYANLSPALILQRHATMSPDRKAVIYEGETYTYREFSARVRSVVTGLVNSGVQAGDRVAYVGFNSATLLELVYACAHIGAIFVPVNFRLAPPEVEFILQHSGASVVIVEETHRAGVQDIAKNLPDVREYFLIDDDASLPAHTAALVNGKPWQLVSHLHLSDPDAAPELAKVDPDDLEVLMYTSGTTGRPKGVMLTYNNLWWNQVNVQSIVDMRIGDVGLAVAPMFHIGGLNATMLGTLTLGGTIVIRRAFNPAQCLSDLVKLKINNMFGVPAMFTAVAEVPGFDIAELGSLRSAIVAGAPVAPSLVLQWAEKGIALQQAWGLSETAPFATYLPGHFATSKPASAGWPMPYTQVKLVNSTDGSDVTEVGIRGEVIVKGPNVTPGYWNDPEVTAKAFDADGWFHSGDVGYLDHDGALYIVDRIKDMIISGGENVYPAEVERVIVEHPSVIECAVVGKPDPQWGETVVAVVKTRDNVALTVDEIRAFAGEYLARYKLPRLVVVLEDIPKNGSGKVLKNELRT